MYLIVSGEFKTEESHTNASSISESGLGETVREFIQVCKNEWFCISFRKRSTMLIEQIMYFAVPIGFLVGIVIYLKRNKVVRLKMEQSVLYTIREMAYKFIAEAEMQWGSGTGALKKAQVVACLMSTPFYTALPNYVKIMVNAKVVGDIVDSVVQYVFNVAMASNKNLVSKISGGTIEFHI